MAITLRYPEVGFIERSGLGKDALDKEIDAMRMRYNQNPLQGSMFVRRETAKGGTYSESTFGTSLMLPPKNEDTDEIPFTQPVPGYKATCTIVNYRLGLRVEKSFVEDDLQGVVRKMMGGLLNSGRLLIEYLIADKMNNLTSSSAGYTGADGAAMAADSHQYERMQGGTWDNYETAAALTLTSFSTARLNLRKRTNEFGYINPLAAKTLVVPPDLEQKAWELKNAEKNPENSTNQPNWLKNQSWQPMVYDYFTDTNGWFILGDAPAEYNGIVYAERIAPSIESVTFENPDVIWGQRLRMRVGIMNVSGMNIEYNIGA